MVFQITEMNMICQRDVENSEIMKQKTEILRKNGEKQVSNGYS